MENHGGTLVYYVFYYMDHRSRSLYYNMDGHDSLLFNEIIAINPHNTMISSVYVRYICDTNEENAVYIYGPNDYLDKIICRIKGTSYLHDEGKKEVLHVIDLWFSKFVPYSRVLCK